MAYADLQILMGKLKQLIYCNDIPMINNPSIVCERPQFLLLYEELGFMIQTLFIHQDQDLGSFEEVRKQRKRFKAAAEEAEDIVDLFLSTVHFRNHGYFPRSDVFHPSLHLEVVMRSIKSIKMEFMALTIDNMKMDLSQKPDRLQTKRAVAVAGTSHTGNSLGSKKVLDEIVVGLDRDVELIRDKLVENRKQLDVVSIVGMGGIGKTTLANKVFTDPFVVYHFYIRAWVTVSQTYENRDLLIQILSYIGVQLDKLEKANDYQLRDMLHKRLMGKRYLIVIDDIWSIKAWDKLKLIFPNNNTGSRILLTSRLTEVVSHVKSDGFIHQLRYLTEVESWELLCGKVFQNKECPKWLIEPGMRIAKNCHGLPLSVVVTAGVLAKEATSKDLWVKVASSVRSYIASDQRGCLETIALSYHHLPFHLRECFLYLGGLPEDSLILVQRLIWLWMAEGFIQEDGNRSLEEIAEGYVIDLVDRNLLIVVIRKFNGDVKACKVHDLVRELCAEKASEERFFQKIDWPSYHPAVITTEKRLSYVPAEEITPPEVITTYKPRRVFTNQEIHIMTFAHPPTPSIRSLLCFHNKTTLIYDIAEYYRSFALLRVLSLQKCKFIDFPPGIALLVHLRYLAIGHSLFPSPICNLWSLQTLILGTWERSMVLPSNISNLVNLRHLRSNTELYLPSTRKPINLQSISNVMLGDGLDNFQKCFPIIKKLACTVYSDAENDFESLLYLESLKLTVSGSHRRTSVEPEFLRDGPKYAKNGIRFPATLKKLTLVRCR